MAKDILMDIGKGELLINNHSNQNELCFSGEWSSSSFSVYIPISYFKKRNIYYKNPCEFSFRTNIPHRTNWDVNGFQLYVHTIDEDGFSYYVCGGRAKAYLYGESELTIINGKHIPLIDIDGEVRVYYKPSVGMVVYSAKESDFQIGDADDQIAQLLSICAPGKYYRYPTTGIDITKYINTAVVNTDLAKRVTEQFDADGMTVQEMSFDPSTGDMKVLFSGGKTEDDAGLLSIDELDLEAIDITDEMLEAAAACIDFDSILEYEDLLPDNVNVEGNRACFSGTWIGDLPWIGNLPWLGE